MLLNLLVLLSVCKLVRGNIGDTDVIIEKTFTELDEERDNLLKFNYTFINTQLKTKYDTLPHKHEHMHKHEKKSRRRRRSIKSHQDNTRKHDNEEKKGCKVKLNIRTLRFEYVHNISLCLFKDHWEEDVVENMVVTIKGEDTEEHIQDYTFMRKVGPVTGYVLHQPGSLVSGYIIHSYFYGQVRLHDWQLNHFIVYYIEPLNMLPWYNRSMSMDEAVNRAKAFNPNANAIMFEYLTNPKRRKLKVEKQKKRHVEPERRNRKPKKTEVVLSTTVASRIRTTRQPKKRKKTSASDLLTEAPKPSAKTEKTKPPSTTSPPPPVVHSTNLPTRLPKKRENKIVHSTTMEPKSPPTEKVMARLTTKAPPETKSISTTVVPPIVHSSTKESSQFTNKSLGVKEVVRSTVKPMEKKEKILPSTPLHLTTVSPKQTTSADVIKHLTTQSTERPDTTTVSITTTQEIGHSSTRKIPVHTSPKHAIVHSTTASPSIIKTKRTKILHPSTVKPERTTPKIFHPTTQSPKKMTTSPIVHLTTAPSLTTTRGPTVRSTPQVPRPTPKLRSTPAVKIYSYFRSTPEPSREYGAFISTPVPPRTAPFYSSTPVPLKKTPVFIASTESTAEKYSHASKGESEKVNGRTKTNEADNLSSDHHTTEHSDDGEKFKRDTNGEIFRDRPVESERDNDAEKTDGDSAVEHGDKFTDEQSRIMNIKRSAKGQTTTEGGVGMPTGRKQFNEKDMFNSTSTPGRHPSALNVSKITTTVPKLRHRRDVESETNSTDTTDTVTMLLDDDNDIIEEVMYRRGKQSGRTDVFNIIRKNSLLCKLCLWLDPEFANLFGFQAGIHYGAAEMIDLIRYLNWVSRAMDFNTDYQAENFGYAVKRVLVSSLEAADSITIDEWENDARKVAPSIANELTTTFGEGACCAIIAFVYKDMPPFGSIAYRRALCVKYKNFAMITGGVQTMKVAKFDIYRFLSHAVGHLMGAINDDVGDTDCFDGKPSTYKNLFIMHSEHQLNIGARPNSMRMSFCSRVKISVFMDSAYTSCFEESRRTFCGNGIVEAGEECDCGAPWQCLFLEECCGLKDSFHACEISKALQTSKCDVPQVMEIDNDPDDLQ